MAYQLLLTVSLLVLLHPGWVYSLVNPGSSFNERIDNVFFKYKDDSKIVQTRADLIPCDKDCERGGLGWNCYNGDDGVGPLGCPDKHWCIYKEAAYGGTETKPDDAPYICVGSSNCGHAQGIYSLVGKTKCCYTKPKAKKLL